MKKHKRGTYTSSQAGETGTGFILLPERTETTDNINETTVFRHCLSGRGEHGALGWGSK